MKINWNQIETKWQTKWSESKDFETNPNEKPKNSLQLHIHIQIHHSILDMEEHTH